MKPTSKAQINWGGGTSSTIFKICPKIHRESFFIYEKFKICLFKIVGFLAMKNLLKNVFCNSY